VLVLQSITLKNFRCFQEKELHLDAPVVIIHGENGSGKTSLVEALGYGCYLHSFRTHAPREMISMGSSTLFIKITGTSPEPWALQAGLSTTKRVIKVNDASITHYKELVDVYRAIIVNSDDIMLMQGAPECRRNFLNQSIQITDPSLYQTLKKYRITLAHRNALLENSYSREMYDVWTYQLWDLTRIIYHQRVAFIASLEIEVRELITKFFDNAFELSLRYAPKKYSLEDSYENFMSSNERLLQQEARYGYSLFGIHLDDLSITFQNKVARTYASRGQQKLVALLLKVAHYKLIGRPVIIVIDDFITDLDDQKSNLVLHMLQSLNSQIIITLPSLQESKTKALFERNPLIISL